MVLLFCFVFYVGMYHVLHTCTFSHVPHTCTAHIEMAHMFWHTCSATWSATCTATCTFTRIGLFSLNFKPHFHMVFTVKIFYSSTLTKLVVLILFLYWSSVCASQEQQNQQRFCKIIELVSIKNITIFNALLLADYKGDVYCLFCNTNKIESFFPFQNIFPIW